MRIIVQCRHERVPFDAAFNEKSTVTDEKIASVSETDCMKRILTKAPCPFDQKHDAWTNVWKKLFRFETFKQLRFSPRLFHEDDADYSLFSAILSQTFTDFELIIVNDRSTKKEVEETVLSYADKRIRYYKNETNLGISGTRNRLIDLSEGRYLAVMDHDDVSLPKRFEKQVGFLNANPDVGIVGTFAKDIVSGRQMTFPTTNADIETDMIFSCPVWHPSAMIRKDILIKTGIRYESRFSPAEDLALYARLLGKTDFANIPEVLFHYRNHANNTSHVQKKKIKAASDAVRRFISTDAPQFYARAMENGKIITKIKLFYILPLFECERWHNERKIRLFGVIPLLKIKEKLRKSKG